MLPPSNQWTRFTYTHRSQIILSACNEIVYTIKRTTVCITFPVYGFSSVSLLLLLLFFFRSIHFYLSVVIIQCVLFHCNCLLSRKFVSGLQHFFPFPFCLSFVLLLFLLLLFCFPIRWVFSLFFSFLFVYFLLILVGVYVHCVYMYLIREVLDFPSSVKSFDDKRQKNGMFVPAGIWLSVENQLTNTFTHWNTESKNSSIAERRELNKKKWFRDIRKKHE